MARTLFVATLCASVIGCGYKLITTVDLHPSDNSDAGLRQLDAGPPYGEANFQPDSAQPETRDKLVWPFAIESIWNMPLGAGAMHVPAMMDPPTDVGTERTFFVVVSADDPVRALLEPGPKPSDPCSGTQQLDSVAVPDSFVLSAKENSSAANATSLLMPDGRTLRELVNLARCDPGGPVFAYPGPIEDIYGMGLRGGQGGSGMSALGGSLRAGEITGRVRIRHALKIDVWANRYLYYDAANPSACYRWPADRCDTKAPDPAPGGYHGNNPAFVQGTLLALPPEITADQLGLTTAPGLLLFAALQDYGAYVVGSTFSDSVLIGFESSALDDFEAQFGFQPSSDQPGSEAWSGDVRKMAAALDLIVNNGESSIGGGGSPRRELAPPIGN